MDNYSPRLLVKYNTEIRRQLQKKLNIENFMRLPKIKKIVLNMGLGNAKDDKNSLKQALEELTTITGQKAVGTKSKKAISNFKIREGDIVGARVTLRSSNMYEFLDRFISVASPRIRDFRGLKSTGFDGRGNYNFGITEQIIFPEINYDQVNSIRGINITVVTSAQSDYEAYELLKSFGFPIQDYNLKKNKNKTKSEEVAPIEEAIPVEEAVPVEEAPDEENSSEHTESKNNESSDNNEKNNSSIEKEKE
tara:strand:+ start:178 stop:927 length:750 start_codon:yes stop_codon:yes gene_type:complete